MYVCAAWLCLVQYCCSALDLADSGSRFFRSSMLQHFGSFRYRSSFFSLLFVCVFFCYSPIFSVCCCSHFVSVVFLQLAIVT